MKEKVCICGRSVYTGKMRDGRVHVCYRGTHICCAPHLFWVHRYQLITMLNIHI